MTKRIKKLRKGINSIEKQINIHLEKRKRAIEEGNIERADYYEKEITGLKKSQDRKKKKILS